MTTILKRHVLFVFLIHFIQQLEKYSLIQFLLFIAVSNFSGLQAWGLLLLIFPVIDKWGATEWGIPLASFTRGVRNRKLRKTPVAV